MIVAHRWIAVLLCLQFAGCTVWQDAKRRLFLEPGEFSWKKDRARSMDIYRDWADEAWNEISRTDPELRCATDYAFGFKDGFVDYVYGGGSGEPPPVPPRRYWNADLRTPNGHEAANQWFEGFRLGVKAAREGGFRDQAVLQSTFRYGLSCDTCDTCDTDVPPYLETPDFEMPSLPIENIGPPTETLPYPEIIDNDPRSSQTPAQVPTEADEKETSLESPFAKYALPWDEKNQPIQTPTPPQKRAAQAEKITQPEKAAPPPRPRRAIRQAIYEEATDSSEQGSTIRIIF